MITWTCLTSIQIKTSTRKRLAGFGRKGQSYDTVLRLLMDDYEGARK